MSDQYPPGTPTVTELATWLESLVVANDYRASDNEDFPSMSAYLQVVNRDWHPHTGNLSYAPSHLGHWGSTVIIQGMPKPYFTIAAQEMLDQVAESFAIEQNS